MGTELDQSGIFPFSPGAQRVPEGSKSRGFQRVPSPEGARNPLAQGVPGTPCGAQGVPWDPGTPSYPPLGLRIIRYRYIYLTTDSDKFYLDTK